MNIFKRILCFHFFHKWMDLSLCKGDHYFDSSTGTEYVNRICIKCHALKLSATKRKQFVERSHIKVLEAKRKANLAYYHSLDEERLKEVIATRLSNINENC